MSGPRKQQTSAVSLLIAAVVALWLILFLMEPSLKRRRARLFLGSAMDPNGTGIRKPVFQPLAAEMRANAHALGTLSVLFRLKRAALTCCLF